jgi:hypothetical protein
MSSIQAYLWNRGSLAIDDKGKAQMASTMRLNTDALQDGGLLRSSDETSVMGVERRGSSLIGCCYMDNCESRKIHLLNIN